MLSIRIGKAMQEVMTVQAERIARETRCSQRTSILGGAGLVQTLVFGYLKSRLATCEELAQVAATLGYPVSPQAIDERCTPQTAECLRQLVEEAVQKAITADDCVSPLLDRFQSVCLQDSSTVGLPDALQEHWRGCETWTDHGGKAALKIQVRFDLGRGAIRLRLEQGRDSDHRTPLQTEEIEAGSLHLRDLGYFDLDVLQQMAEKGAYFISRVQDNTALLQPDGERIEVAKYSRQVQGQAAGSAHSAGRWPPPSLPAGRGAGSAGSRPSPPKNGTGEGEEETVHAVAGEAVALRVEHLRDERWPGIAVAGRGVGVGTDAVANRTDVQALEIPRGLGRDA